MPSKCIPLIVADFSDIPAEEKSKKNYCPYWITWICNDKKMFYERMDWPNGHSTALQWQEADWKSHPCIVIAWDAGQSRIPLIFKAHS